MMHEENKNQDCLLSIIVPIYNAERYIENNLENILAQSVRIKYEVICVNDGSTDNSRAIVCKYAEQDDRIYLIDTPNQGVAAARNTGLQAAQGKYVWFIDADDWIARDCLSIIFREMEENSPSVIKVQYDYIKAEWRVKECLKAFLKKSEIECRKVDVVDVPSLPDSPVWPYIIKKELLLRYRMHFIEDLHYGEDIIFVRRLLDYMHLERDKDGIEHVALLLSGDHFYYYRQHDASAMSQSTKEKRTHYTQALLKTSQFYRDRMEEDMPHWYHQQYKELLFVRMYTYMMYWLPHECINLTEHMDYLKKERLYPCVAPSKEARNKLVASNGMLQKIKDYYRYYSFMHAWLYPTYFAIMNKKFRAQEQNGVAKDEG